MEINVVYVTVPSILLNMSLALPWLLCLYQRRRIKLNMGVRSKKSTFYNEKRLGLANRSRNLIQNNLVPAQKDGVSFFHFQNLAHKVCLLTKTFSEALQKERNQLLKEKKQPEKLF